MIDNMYSVILCDAPWGYSDGKNRHGGVDRHYSTMSTQELMALPVSSLANENCALFLWATFPLLPTCISVMESWGFTYKTLAFSWLKTNKDGSPFFGGGHYTRANQEVCLLGVKGNVARMVQSRSVHSFIQSQRGRHSEKPNEVRERIVSLLGDVPRIELFARERVPGWSAFGDEVDGDIVLVDGRFEKRNVE